MTISNTWINFRDIILDEKKPNIKVYLHYDSIYIVHKQVKPICDTKNHNQSYLWGKKSGASDWEGTKRRLPECSLHKYVHFVIIL